MALHAPLVTGSWICCVPRLIIAPQAFLKPMRPSSFKLTVNPDAVAVGIYSGNVKMHLNYFPNIIHDLEALPPNTVHKITIDRKEPKGSDSDSSDLPPPHANLFGPLGVLPVIGVLMSIGLLVLAIIKDDGAAVVALVLLSVTSSLTGVGSLWQLQLQKRPASTSTSRNLELLPMSDVLVRNSKGTFLVVHCTETVARELYFTQEICHYRYDYKIFRICSGLATFAHMAGVIFLANCTWVLQAAIGLAYLVLNGAYWFGAVLPAKVSWNLEMFDVEPKDWHHQAKKAKSQSYTHCLWEVAKMTKTARWASLGGIVPTTDAWKKWVEEADENCAQNPKWDFQKRLTELLSEYKAQGAPRPGYIVTGQTALIEGDQGQKS